MTRYKEGRERPTIPSLTRIRNIIEMEWPNDSRREIALRAVDDALRELYSRVDDHEVDDRWGGISDKGRMR